MEAYIGSILPWAGSYAPQDWLFCWGQELQINQFQALFAVIGTQYGGNGTTTFKLPDLRGRFPIGAGLNPATNTNWVPGTYNDNNMKANIGVNNMPVHNHAIANTVTGPTGGTPVQLSFDIGVPVNTDNPNTAGVNVPANNNCTLAVGKVSPQGYTVNMYTTNAPTPNATLKPFNVQQTVNIPTPAIQVNSACGTAGSGAALDIKPPSLCLNFIICIQGIFPPRQY